MGFATYFSVFVVVLAISLYSLRQYNQGCVFQDKVDLTGQNVIITGGHSGIGYETSKGLAKQGATLFIACRDLDKGQQAANLLKSETKNNNIEILPLDLSSLTSVRNFSTEFLKRKIPVNILINNAGAWMGNERQTTEDGHEMTFGVNHLGHFLLTNLLWEEILRGKGRVVTVSSGMHLRGKIDFSDLQLENNYTHIEAYANSKLANVLFANELARLLEGTGVTSLSLHPGLITTGLHKEQEKEYPLLMWLFYKQLLGYIGKTLEAGAQTTLTAAISPKLDGKTGVYLADCDIDQPNPIAMDVDIAKKLWEESRKLVNLETTIHRTVTKQ